MFIALCSNCYSQLACISLLYNYITEYKKYIWSILLIFLLLGCVCYQLGTNTALGECDRQTGQCPCLPNVIGQRCDQCAPAHWNLTSREGCTHCGCDPTGSLSLECNQVSTWGTLLLSQRRDSLSDIHWKSLDSVEVLFKKKNVHTTYASIFSRKICWSLR